MNALEVAITTLMLADTASGGLNHATTGATGGFHQGTAPQSATFPRIHFQKIQKRPLYAFKNLSARYLYYQLTAFAVDSNEAGADTAGRLAERAEALFTDPSLTVTGQLVQYCRPAVSIPDRFDWDETNSRYIYSKGFYLELWLAPA